MSIPKNVFNLDTNNPVYQDIEIYLRKLKKENVNTYKAYKRYIESFFIWLVGKKLNELEIKDLKFSNSKVVSYQLYLSDDLDRSNSTVNLATTSIYNLYLFLEKQEIYRKNEIEAKMVKVDSLSNQGETSGEFRMGEPEQMASLALNHKKKGQEKYAFIRLAYTTGIRKQTILNIKWDDIKPYELDNSIYLIDITTKNNKKLTIPITSSLYNELLKIKEQTYYNRYTDNKIFHLSSQAIQDMMDDLKELMQIDKKRNIVFHSFRGYPSHFGELEELQNQLGHSSINTTKKYYRHSEDHSNMLSLRMEEKIDDSIFQEMTKEELIEMIMNQSKGTILNLKRKANNILKNKG